ncbi:MAG: hypothetical protein DRQ56_10725, partial [Gammaproteobacteria bacterium]
MNPLKMTIAAIDTLCELIRTYTSIRSDWVKRPNNKRHSRDVDRLIDAIKEGRSPDPQTFPILRIIFRSNEFNGLAAFKATLETDFKEGQCTIGAWSWSRVWIGVGSMRTGQPEDAIALFREVIERYETLGHPNSLEEQVADAYSNLIAALLDSNRNDEAISCGRIGLRAVAMGSFFPQSSGGHRDLSWNGLCAGSLLMDLDACRDFASMLSKNPECRKRSSQTFKDLLKDPDIGWFLQTPLCAQLLPELALAAGNQKPRTFPSVLILAASPLCQD